MRILTVALSIVLWYGIFGCIATFAYLRKSYLERESHGEERHSTRLPLLNFFLFYEMSFGQWFLQMVCWFAGLIIIWPALLHQDQALFAPEFEKYT